MNQQYIQVELTVEQFLLTNTVLSLRTNSISKSMIEKSAHFYKMSYDYLGL